jgi:hypothetical protein
MGAIMKFSTPVRAPDGLTSYARTSQVRPVSTLINIIEALLSLMGVTILVMVVLCGSFEKAGLVIDQTLSCAQTPGCVHMSFDKAIAKLHK